MMRLHFAWILILTCWLALAGCSGKDGIGIFAVSATASATLTPSFTPSPTQTSTPTLTPTPTATPTPTVTPTPAPFVLTGAGDISICGLPGDTQTAALLAKIPGEIFTAGDNSNDEGTAAEFKGCFGKSWGQFKERIHPAPGNHDLYTDGGAPYYAYFGSAAGKAGQGWYSYSAGSWHVVVLNSNCNDVACGKDSPQIKWLRADLANHPAKCTLAVWHHPRWSSGIPGSDGHMSAAYRALYDAGAEIVISGHDHDYERFMPLDPQGKPDPSRGIRQFVVGTGGAYPRRFDDTILDGSQEHKTDLFGVLSLSLYPDHYDWRFIPVAGEKYTDSGSASCH